MYPLLPDGTCRFLVFDFDNHEKGAEASDFANTDNEWHKEVDALRRICEINGIHPLVSLCTVYMKVANRSAPDGLNSWTFIVITRDPEEVAYGSANICYELVDRMRKAGIEVVTRTEVEEHFAVLDDELVWHGGMNLLGKADVWDNLMRTRDDQAAAELLEIALDNGKPYG